MKDFIKKFKLYFIFLFIFLVIILILTYFYNRYYRTHTMPGAMAPIICKSIATNDYSALSSFNEYVLAEAMESYAPFCPKKVGYSWWMHYNNLGHVFDTSLHIFPIIVFILVGIYYSSYIKTNYFSYELVRDKYKKVINKHIHNMYFISTFMPVVAILLIILLSLIGGNLSDSELVSAFNGNTYIPDLYQDKMLLFYILFVVNLFLYGIILANILILVFKKIKNVIVAVLSSYVIYNVFNILTYNVLALFLIYVIIPHINYSGDVGILWNYFDMETVWHPQVINNPLLFTLFMFILTIISSILVKIFYRNKESVVMSNEA